MHPTKLKLSNAISDVVNAAGTPNPKNMRGGLDLLLPERHLVQTDSLASLANSFGSKDG